MNNDIKEIKITFPGQILDYVDSKEHILELFNYIINLQEKNKEILTKWLKLNQLVDKLDKELSHKTDQYEILRHRDNISYYENEITRLNNIIDKAIKYIKQDNELSVDCYYKFKDLSEFDDLLNILGGKR